MDTQAKAIIKVNGKETEVEAPTPYGQVIEEIARQNSWSEVKVQMIDPTTKRQVEITMRQAPQFVQPGDYIEVFPYDRAAK